MLYEVITNRCHAGAARYHNNFVAIASQIEFPIGTVDFDFIAF